jgi:hypothetical protein
MEQASPAVLDDEAVDDDDDFAPSSPGTTPTVPTFLLPPERVIITQPTPAKENTNDRSVPKAIVSVNLSCFL